MKKKSVHVKKGKKKTNDKKHPTHIDDNITMQDVYFFKPTIVIATAETT
jgi:hypothetical protein